MHYPITAIISIMHRISGIFTYLSMGFLFWLLRLSLSSHKGFNQTLYIIHNLFFKIILWFLLTVFSYHIICGIRHILIDFRCLKETLQVGLITAKIVLFLTLISSILIGLYIW